MTADHARPGMRVRVMEHHRVEERRGLVGTIVARYGGEDYVAVDVRLVGGQYRLFWPRDLEEIPGVFGGPLEAGPAHSVETGVMWLQIPEIDRTARLGFRALLTENGIERLDLTRA